MLNALESNAYPLEIVKWILIEFLKKKKIIEAFCLNDIDKLLVYALVGVRSSAKLTRMRCLTENRLVAEPHNIHSKYSNVCFDVNNVLSYSIKAALRQSTCTVLIRVNGFECARLVGTKERERERRNNDTKQDVVYGNDNYNDGDDDEVLAILYRKKMWPVDTEQMRYD